MEGDKPKTKRSADYAIGYFHIDIAKIRTEEGKAAVRISPVSSNQKQLTSRSVTVLTTMGLGSPVLLTA